jgi:hypothetical protein
MSSNLLRVMVKQPDVLLDHAQAYAELFEAELATLGTATTRRIYLSTAAVCCMAIGVTLAGTALMLLSMLPHAEPYALWALGLIPLIPFAATLWCIVALRSTTLVPFELLRRQISADIHMLRGATCP